MDFKHLFLKSYFNSSQRARTWKKLATFSKNRIGEKRGLELLRDRYVERKHPLAKVFSSILDEINKGHPLDVAIYPWVPHEEVMLIRGGNKSGRMMEAFSDCAALIQARQKITSSLVGAVSYPLVLASLFMALLITVSVYVVPELAQISNPEQWEGSAAALYAVAQFVTSITGIILFTALFAGLALAVVTLPYWTGKVRIRFDQAPPWSIYRLLTGSVWLFTVATLLRANISLDDILRDMLESEVMKPWLRERVALIRERYQVEGNFGALLQHLNMNFPDKELVEDLAVYASLPDFHKDMYSIAKDWLDEGVERIAAQAKILNTGMLVCIMVLLCGIGLAVGSLQQQLTGSMGAM